MRQLELHFPAFDFEKAKAAMLQADVFRLQQQIEHLKYVIRAHKGHYTRIKKKK